MGYRHIYGYLCVVMLWSVFLSTACSQGQAAHIARSLTPTPPGWSAPDPHRIKASEDAHQKIMETKPDILFIGDSITENWRTDGKAVWDANFKPMNAFNYGAGGDMIQHVLWRIVTYQWEGVAPKAIVLLIGANHGGNAEIHQGIKNLIVVMNKTFPTAKIICMSTFPYNMKFKEEKTRHFISNKYLPDLEKEFPFVRVLDITTKLLDPNGDVTPEFFKDGQHISEKGYQVWAAELLPVLKEAVGAEKK